MEYKLEEDNVGNKLDKLNSAIGNLIKDLNLSRCENDRFSMISPIHSFSEDFNEDTEEFLDISLRTCKIPQNFFDKFQEMLTENDRLGMKNEDLAARLAQTEVPLLEIPVSGDQLRSLNQDIQKLIDENVAEALIRAGSNYFILEPKNKPGKVIYFAECEMKEEESVSKEKSADDTLDAAMKLAKLQAELELKYLELSKREEHIRSLEEELGFSIQRLETIKNDYYERLSAISTENSFHSTPTKTKRTESCFSSANKSLYSDSISIQSIDPLKPHNCDKVLQERKMIFTQDSFSDANTKLSENRRAFNESLLRSGRFSKKERYIMQYLKEQSKYQEEKILELQEYEKYLQDTWVESFGQINGVAVLQKASQKNFQFAMKLKKEREEIDLKEMRLQKLIQITKSENTRLEFHRKKIWNERQLLIKKQGDIEKYLSSI